MLPLNELKIGFALEGNGDYPILPCLTRRLIQNGFPQIQLAADSILRPRKRGHGFISELPTFATLLNDDRCDLLVAVVDTDNLRVNDRLNRLREAKRLCSERGIALCVAEGVAVRSVEAWLMADGDALHHVFSGDRSLCEYHRPEEVEDPKLELNTLTRRLTDGVEVSYASFAGDIAERIRLNILRRRCSHFNDLAQNILNCVRSLQTQLQSAALRVP